jgi:nicotinamidase-related amidase
MNVQQFAPLAFEDFDASGSAGLVIVDEVNGFATTGAGNLAPPLPNAQVDRMVAETNTLAQKFAAAGKPMLAFLDTHEPGVPEPPYPPHCERGTGEENLVAPLAWLEKNDKTTLIRKDCINGFIGAIGRDGSNRLVEWVTLNDIQAMLVVGICTDICVMDFVLTTLSARNHGLLGNLRDVVVYEPGCATYDLNRETAQSLGLPETAIHPQFFTHHMGLYFMASRGAHLSQRIIGL